jgi:ectoine hydroxylase
LAGEFALRYVPIDEPISKFLETPTSGRIMKLSPGQLKEFDEQGYLFFPNCFSEEEIALLRDDAEAILKLDRKEVWREKTGAPRTAFAAHTFNETFRLMAHHPRLVEPLRQLFGEDVYVHQFKLNAKAAFEGDVWQWHQDYGTWARDDGMPEPRAMNIAIFLDEVMPINGALMVIPKSHKKGVLAAGHDTATTSYPLWTLDKETVTRLAAEGGIVAPTGKPGSVLMFHGNLVHASPPNITPYPRKIVYLTLCAVSNHITKFTREEWIAHRDFTPIVPVADDALLTYARAHKVAAE